MPATTKLKAALDAIESAQRALRRAKAETPDDPNIRKAAREVQEAEDEIRRAIREIED